MRPTVHGLELDSKTRCLHWNSALDIIAIRMRCCVTYYACRECHDALAQHVTEVWPRTEWDERAVLCGACGYELTVRQYLRGQSQCPECRAGFNPGCHRHRHLYFAAEMDPPMAEP